MSILESIKGIFEINVKKTMSFHQSEELSIIHKEIIKHQSKDLRDENYLSLLFSKKKRLESMVYGN